MAIEGPDTAQPSFYAAQSTSLQLRCSVACRGLVDSSSRDLSHPTTRSCTTRVASHVDRATAQAMHVGICSNTMSNHLSTTLNVHTACSRNFHASVTIHSKLCNPKARIVVYRRAHDSISGSRHSSTHPGRGSTSSGTRCRTCGGFAGPSLHNDLHYQVAKRSPMAWIV